MAHLLGVENLRLTVGSRLLLDEVTLGLEDGTRVGVLGPNGAGKSTFLAALAGRREPDGGRVTRTGGVSVAVLSQADDLPPGTTVRTAVHPRGEACETWIMTRIGPREESGERARGAVIVAQSCEAVPPAAEEPVSVS